VEEPEPEVVPESSPVELPFEESEDEHELAIAPAVIASKSRRQTMGDVLGRRPSQGPQPEAVGPSSPIRHGKGQHLKAAWSMTDCPAGSHCLRRCIPDGSWQCPPRSP
jgi:hypothetical protein